MHTHAHYGWCRDAHEDKLAYKRLLAPLKKAYGGDSWEVPLPTSHEPCIPDYVCERRHTAMDSILKAVMVTVYVRLSRLFLRPSIMSPGPTMTL